MKWSLRMGGHQYLLRVGLLHNAGAPLLERGLPPNRSTGIGTGAEPPVWRWLAA